MGQDFQSSPEKRRHVSFFVSLFSYDYYVRELNEKKETKEKTINVFQFRIRKRGLSFQSFPAYGLAKH